MATINLFTFAFSALFILYATRQLGVEPGLLGLALGSSAIGGVLGAIIASRVGRRVGLGAANALGCVVFPVSLLAIPVAAPGMDLAIVSRCCLPRNSGPGSA